MPPPDPPARTSMSLPQMRQNLSLQITSIQVAVAQPADRQGRSFFFFYIAPLRRAFRRTKGTPRGLAVSLDKTAPGAFLGAGTVAVKAHAANCRQCR